MVQKDPGGMEAQIPEPPRCRRAVTGPQPLPSLPGHAPQCGLCRHPGCFRPPASHLKGDADGGTLQLFNLKEKKKKYPTTQRTKPIMNRNSGSLCLLSVLCGGLPELSLSRSPSTVHIRLIPTQTGRPASPPCTLVSC